MSSIFQVKVRVVGNNSGLIRLGDISEDNVDKSDQESIVVGLTSVVDDWDNVGSLLRHIDKISSNSVRELDSVNDSLSSHNIRNMGNSGARSATEVKHLSARENASLGHAANHSCGNFRAIWVPHSVLNLLSVHFDANTLLVVDGLSRY